MTTIPFSVSPSGSAPATKPRCFSDLLPAGDWHRLPQTTRKRFSQPLTAHTAIVFTGHTVMTRFSKTGWWLAQTARLIGAPLPTSTAIGLASVVSITPGDGAQIWSRQYSRHRQFPQVIHSSKRFAGPTGLEEDIGHGFGMALRLAVTTDGRLLFRSDHFFVRFGGLRWRLPHWLGPGRLTVIHTDLAQGRFQFELHIDHPWLGRLLQQQIIFRDRQSC